MARLIDADRALEIVRDQGIAHPNAYYLTNYATLILREAPTVDAVEVVRCKDCKHRGTDYCIFHIKGEPADEELLRKLDNDFCSYGERKGGDGNACKEKDGVDGG